jgi:hypothetical protein
MRMYNNNCNGKSRDNIISLLLLQTMFVASSRICQNRRLLDDHSSSREATKIFYKRAKTLFDCRFEKNTITVIQSVVLMGWFTDDVEQVNNNAFFWPRVAISLAQSLGLHRMGEHSSVPVSKRKLWQRIWWGLYVRDRYSAIAMDKPLMIDIGDCNIPMLTEDDL